jgi:serine/threonine protein kinase
MKFCPICDRRYDDEVDHCDADSATLKLLGGSHDAYIGNVVKGRYNVISKLGEGGMGAVYLAEQITIGRKVALKVLKGKFASEDEFIGRFRREARSAASINHRNVVTIYDFDQANDGSLFIAMEYLPGVKLSEIVKRDGSLPSGRAIRIGLQIAEGLDAAHRAGVIHRDIKPDNVMIIEKRGGDEVKLMDFGIARLQESVASNLTRTGVIMGTPAYMAPEQAEGTQVSEKTDIYALGIVLYEMLTGSVPFKAPTPSAVLVKQLQEPPIPLRKVRKEISAAIDRLVMRALEKNPEKRQPDMSKVVEGLQEIAFDIRGAGNTVAESNTETLLLKRPQQIGPSLRSLVKPKLIAFALALMAIAFSAWLFVRPRETQTMQTTQTIVGLSIRPEKQELQVKERVKLTAIGLLSDKSESPVTAQLEWKSDNDSVLGVTADGQAEGRKIGTAQVTVRNEKLLSPPVTFTVKQSEDTARKVEALIKNAFAFRDRGEYAKAFSELRSAQDLDPSNETVTRELRQTSNACLTEKKLGLTKDDCS